MQLRRRSVPRNSSLPVLVPSCPHVFLASNFTPKFMSSLPSCAILLPPSTRPRHRSSKSHTTVELRVPLTVRSFTSVLRCLLFYFFLSITIALMAAPAAAAVAAPAPACPSYVGPSQLSGTWCVYWNNRIGDGMKFGFDFTYF
jgi:hypothetical protein